MDTMEDRLAKIEEKLLEISSTIGAIATKQEVTATFQKSTAKTLDKTVDNLKSLSEDMQKIILVEERLGNHDERIKSLETRWERTAGYILKTFLGLVITGAMYALLLLKGVK